MNVSKLRTRKANASKLERANVIGILKHGFPSFFYLSLSIQSAMRKQILFFLSLLASQGSFAQERFMMNMTFDDSLRNFTVFLPRAYTAGAHLPVVFNLHGRGSDA